MTCEEALKRVEVWRDVMGVEATGLAGAAYALADEVKRLRAMEARATGMANAFPGDDRYMQGAVSAAREILNG